MILEAATYDTAAAVALKMRPRDRDEFLAVAAVEDDKIAAWIADRMGRRDGILCARAGDGEPVSIGGAVEVRPGSATLLFYATERFPEIALPMTRFIRRHYFPSLAAAGTHRIECVTLDSYRAMQRWLETLGLKREATIPAYGKGRETFAMYAWIAPPCLSA
ncbi:hypothetical protein [Methylobacterium brachiatum]|uniref:hypothetical protein n=1 Tax=Methylobacterium brachiatum TaxID=269660 RepID=UPI0008DF9277|nr:hypothetical protein [Methylobacterium brachiatum]SFI05768.1 hypothetical protein SAMN02799642_00576 [Methylobacterium brachiatum]